MRRPQFCLRVRSRWARKIRKWHKSLPSRWQPSSHQRARLTLFALTASRMNRHIHAHRTSHIATRARLALQPRPNDTDRCPISHPLALAGLLLLVVVVIALSLASLASGQRELARGGGHAAQALAQDWPQRGSATRRHLGHAQAVRQPSTWRCCDRRHGQLARRARRGQVGGTPP